MGERKRYVFFDRDGTLIEHMHHLVDFRKVKIKSDMAHALVKLSRHGFNLGMVTNQSVISRGTASEEDVYRINKVIEDELAKVSVRFEFIRICPHQEINKCECRKPKTGLVQDYLNTNKIELGSSFMVGDQDTDIEFGLNLGVNTVQIRGLGSIHPKTDFVGDNLQEIADWIIKQKNDK